MVGLVLAWSVVIHDRVSWVRWKFINYTGHHTLHHWYYQYNLGQFTTIWDRIGGTYKDPELRYADIPAGVVVRWQDGPGKLVGPHAPTPSDVRPGFIAAD
jgi:lathosterol oxidase